MFSSATNPYDELVVKATDENLASEDWALNLEVCDKVSGDGQTGARNAVAALQKRLAHRNPNVQLYALELANTLAQNCGKPLMGELSSRTWTGALDRLVNDRATPGPVKKKALGYIKAWAKQFEETGDANLGIMGELYDQLRAKNFNFDEQEAVPEDRDAARRRQEEEELQRVLELSKQDKGGRTGYSTYQPGSTAAAAVPGGSSSSSSAYPHAAVAAQAQAPSHTPQPFRAQPAAEVIDPPRQPVVLDLNTATRVRALYTFTSNEVGELNFERGDVIKVLDRGFKEWWRGASNGRIGIFPVTYVEAMPEPTPRELQEEAQEEAKVFASLGLVDQLLQTLKTIDPARGDRLDDKPEIEELYQASVGLQGQINALIKKYSDQKAELEHMNANFLRAMRQYEELRNPPPPPAGQPQYHYGPPPPAENHAQYPQHPGAPQHTASYQSQPPQQFYPQQPGQPYPQGVPTIHHNHSATDINQPVAPAPGQYYQQAAHSSASLHRVPSGAPNFPPHSPGRQETDPGAAGIGSVADPSENQAAWDAYYRAQGQQPPPQPGHQNSLDSNHGGNGGGGYQAQPYPDQQYVVPQYSNATADPQQQQQPGYGQSPYPSQGQPGGPVPHGQVDGVAQGMSRMSVHGQ